MRVRWYGTWPSLLSRPEDGVFPLEVDEGEGWEELRSFGLKPNLYQKQLIKTGLSCVCI